MVALLDASILAFVRKETTHDPDFRHGDELCCLLLLSLSPLCVRLRTQLYLSSWTPRWFTLVCVGPLRRIALLDTPGAPGQGTLVDGLVTILVHWGSTDAAKKRDCIPGIRRCFNHLRKVQGLDRVPLPSGPSSRNALAPSL